MEYLIQSIFLKRPTNASLKNTVMYLAKPELGGKNSVDLSLEDKATVNVNKKVKQKDDVSDYKFKYFEYISKDC